MGYIYLNALQTATLPDKEEKYSKLAADFYQKVLQFDQNNIYAAHGSYPSLWVQMSGHNCPMARVGWGKWVVGSF